MDLALIHLITKLSMQGPDPHQFYPGKTSNHSLAQQIKEEYGNVENWKRGYKVASIQDGQHKSQDSYLTLQEVCQRDENELGELPHKRVGEGLSWSAGPRLRVPL